MLLSALNAPIGVDQAIEAGFKYYGILGGIAVVFAVVIVFLFRMWRSDGKEWGGERKAILIERDDEREKAAKERMDTALERQKFIDRIEALRDEFRLEYEEKHRQLVEHYAQNLRAERDQNRAHEDAARREFIVLMERVQAENHKTAEELVKMLQKFYDRFVGPRGRY